VSLYLLVASHGGRFRSNSIVGGFLQRVPSKIPQIYSSFTMVACSYIPLIHEILSPFCILVSCCPTTECGEGKSAMKILFPSKSMLSPHFCCALDFVITALLWIVVVPLLVDSVMKGMTFNAISNAAQSDGRKDGGVDSGYSVLPDSSFIPMIVSSLQAYGQTLVWTMSFCCCGCCCSWSLAVMPHFSEGLDHRFESWHCAG